MAANDAIDFSLSYSSSTERLFSQYGDLSNLTDPTQPFVMGDIPSLVVFENDSNLIPIVSFTEEQQHQHPQQQQHHYHHYSNQQQLQRHRQHIHQHHQQQQLQQLHQIHQQQQQLHQQLHPHHHQPQQSPPQQHQQLHPHHHQPQQSPPQLHQQLHPHHPQQSPPQQQLTPPQQQSPHIIPENHSPRYNFQPEPFLIKEDEDDEISQKRKRSNSHGLRGSEGVSVNNRSRRRSASADHQIPTRPPNSIPLNNSSVSPTRTPDNLFLSIEPYTYVPPPEDLKVLPLDPIVRVVPNKDDFSMSPHGPFTCEMNGTMSTKQKQILQTTLQLVPLANVDRYFDDIRRFLQEVDKDINYCHSTIQKTPLPFHEMLGRELTQRILLWVEKIQEHSEHSNLVERQFLFPVLELIQLGNLRRDLNFRRQQLLVFKNEVDYCVRNQQYNILFVDIFFWEQPFPAPAKQSTHVDSVELRILTGAKGKVREPAQVTAELANPNITRLSMTIEGGTAPLNGNVVEFNNLKFSSGSQCKEVSLRFCMTAQADLGSGNYSNRLYQTTSPESEPFIVLTNTKQWLDAQYQLMKNDLFKSRPEISFFEFCNSLQKHFLRALGQSGNQERPLLPKDIEFLFTRIMNKNLQNPVLQKDFDNLWVWFGPVLRNIRYEPGIRQFWTNGLFWGFLTTPEAEGLLEPYSPGTFLLRFSTTVKGGLVVSYKQNRIRVRQYLIKRQGSLEDFLRSQNALVRFLKIQYQDPTTVKVVVMEKDTAFTMLGLKKKPLKNPEKECSYDFDMHTLQY